MRPKKSSTLFLSIILLSSTAFATPLKAANNNSPPGLSIAAANTNVGGASHHNRAGQIPSTVLAPLPSLASSSSNAAANPQGNGGGVGLQHATSNANPAAAAVEHSPVHGNNNVPSAHPGTPPSSGVILSSPVTPAQPIASMTTPDSTAAPLQQSEASSTRNNRSSSYLNAMAAGSSTTTSSAQSSTIPQASIVEGEANIPYETMLPKGAELVAGDPTKNEFFIVAAEDAQQIKSLLDHAKPGIEVADNTSSKRPILKVKLDENNATLLSMNVISSINEVVKSAKGPSVKLTANDEVLTIFTKKRMTPVGSRVAAPSAVTKMTASLDDKPILKLFTMPSASQPANNHSIENVNPLATVASVKPTRGYMPEVVVAQRTISQPTEKPVALPSVSQERGPTLEMVLQQAKNGRVKKSNDNAVPVSTKFALINGAAATIKAPAAISKPHAAIKVSTDKKKVVAGAVIPYETLTNEQAAKSDIKPQNWKIRHKLAVGAVDKAALSVIENKKILTSQNVKANKAVKAAKGVLQVGVIKNYSDYLGKPTQQADSNLE